jgi:predicted transcriptional regulator
MEGTMKNLELNEDSALVLQQIEESGEEDFDNLRENLLFNRSYLAHILQNLKHKGLIKTRGHWISLSGKGKKTSEILWPKIDYIRY